MSGGLVERMSWGLVAVTLGLCSPAGHLQWSLGLVAVSLGCRGIVGFSRHVVGFFSQCVVWFCRLILISSV